MHVARIFKEPALTPTSSIYTLAEPLQEQQEQEEIIAEIGWPYLTESDCDDSGRMAHIVDWERLEWPVE